MPWKETWPMQERCKLVSWQQTGRYTVTELAREFGVSRKTAYKWLSRFEQEGASGLENRSRAPDRHPNATSAPVVAAVLEAKLAHPTWGPAKLQPAAETAPEVAQAWPAPSTRGSILARHGLTTPRHQRRRVAPWAQPFRQCDGPNAVWCADFKGWVRTGDGQRCEPLTVSDAFSRMLLRCQVVARTDTAHVRPVFERAFREYGLPHAIRTDNGAPFASRGIGGLSRLGVWWIKLGILPERIQPGHPEENGRHERLHRTLKAETMHPPAATATAQQQRFDTFRTVYNTERPHQALGQVPPAAVYVPSTRPYPRRLHDLIYPESAQVRRVRSDGAIQWRGALVYVSEALVGEILGITEEPHAWLLSFGPLPLGLLHPGCSTVERLKSVTHVPG